VSHDFESWRPKLKPGAVVLFHDTNVRENNFGVWKVWAKIQEDFPNTIEFFHSHGLGVVQIGGPVEAELPWLKPDFEGRKDLIAYFAGLGGAQLDRFGLKWARAEIEAQHQAILDRDNGARRQGEELAAAYAKLDSVHTEMNAYADRLKDRVASLEQREIDLAAELAAAYARLGEVHSEMNAYVDRLKDRIGHLEAQYSDLEVVLQARGAALASLEAELQARDVALAAMSGSTSWKITSPLRWIGRALSPRRANA